MKATPSVIAKVTEGQFKGYVTTGHGPEQPRFAGSVEGYPMLYTGNSLSSVVSQIKSAIRMLQA